MPRDCRSTTQALTLLPPRLVRIARSKCAFTLIEILVVLAIMVILFGLLFAPMVAGLDLVRRGKRHVDMQDAVRLAMEQMSRELSEAVYVFDPDVVDVTAVSGNATSLKVVDYSTVTFAPAQRDATGQLITPLRPEVLDVYDPNLAADVPCFRAVRFTVHLADDRLDPGTLKPLVPHGEDNPFAVFRQEGYVREDPPGSGHWGWWADKVVSENALTPRSGADLAPSVSLCESCGSMWMGYAPVCLNSACADADTAVGMRYITEGLQFVPQRTVGEILAASEDGVVYSARHGGWLGVQNDGSQAYTTADLPLPGTELNPRLVVYRYDPDPEVQDWTVRVLDTLEAAPSPEPALVIRWDSGTGSVRFGDWRASGPVFDVSPDPGMGFYPLSIDGDASDGLSADVYDATGNRSSGASYTQDIYPIYPPAPETASDPRVPIAYVIDPTWNGAKVPAKLVRRNISVRLLVQYSAGGGTSHPYRYYNLQPTSNYDQDRIGRWQFCPYVSQDQRTAQIRFNRNDPPSPDWFGGSDALSAFAIEVRYYERCNFDPTSNKDDIVVADYSTRHAMNVCLTVGTYVDLEPSPAMAGLFVLPTDVRLHRIQVRDQVVIRNAMD